jgi:hypothetical protein
MVKTMQNLSQKKTKEVSSAASALKTGIGWQVVKGGMPNVM